MPTFDPRTTDRWFHLAIPDVVAAVLLPPLRQLLLRSAPQCHLSVAPWPGRNVDPMRFDMAIATEPAIFPGFRIEPLFDDHDVLAFRSGSEAPSIDDALRRPHVAVVPSGFSRDLADDWLTAEGRSRSIALVVPHYLQALNLVANSDLLAILPHRLVATTGRALGVDHVELPVPQAPDRYWLLHPAHLTSDPASRWLRETVRRAADPIGASA